MPTRFCPFRIWRFEQKLPGRVDEAPFFKMEKAGVYPFSLGTSEGTIAVLDYQQANYREVTSKEAAELIRNIQPFILDVRTRPNMTGDI